MLQRSVIIFVMFFISIPTALADDGNKPAIEYFIDNIFIRALIAGGYYTVAVIVILVIIAFVSKVFKKIILSTLLAVLGLLLMVFFFQALQNLQFIP